MCLGFTTIRDTEHPLEIVRYSAGVGRLLHTILLSNYNKQKS